MQKNMYQKMVDFCKIFEIDPFKKGNNPEASLRFIGLKDTFNLNEIDFSLQKIKEITGIGEIINNLISQKTNIHNMSTEEGEKLFEIQNAIEVVLPVLEYVLSRLLDKELVKKGTSQEKLDIEILNGLIFKKDKNKAEALFKALHQAGEKSRKKDYQHNKYPYHDGRRLC